MRKTTSGFTIIEILVVIAVIGILSTISVLSFTRYQADARDSQRSARVTILAEALEKYYDANGEYPSCTAMMDAAATVTTTTLPGVDTTVLRAPKADAAQTNSIDFCTDLSPSTTSDSFAYVGDGSTTCSTTACLAFSLQYKEESTGDIVTVTSRRTTDILTSGSISDLVAAAQGFQQINLNWTAVANASSYAVQISTTVGFASPTNLTAASTNSTSSTGLTAGTPYWYRVAPIGAGVQGDWSNIATATTSSLGTPTCTATANGISQIDVSWTSVASATSYTLQYANNSGFSSGLVTVNSLPTSPRTYSITGLSAGNTRYVHVRGAAVGDTGDYCAYQSATTTVPAPTCLSATTNSTTQITASWAACPVAVADTYTLQYADNVGFTSPTSITGLTGTTRAVTGLISGKSYWFRLYALVGAVSSLTSPTATATTSIDTPTSVGVSTSVPGAVRAYSAGDWVAWIDTPSSGNWYYASGSASGTCAGGTTLQYQHGANYNSPTTFYGYTGWSTTSVKYMVQPYSGYAIRFHVNARCAGSDLSSGTVNVVSGYVYN